MTANHPPPEAHSVRLLQNQIGRHLAQSLPIPMASNATLDKNILLDLAVDSTSRNRTITATLELKKVNGNAPCDSDTAFYHLNKLSETTAMTWFRENNKMLLIQSKARGALHGARWAAIDEKRKPFYGKPDPLTTSGQRKAGTNRAYGVITSESLASRQRPTLALEPRHPLESPVKPFEAVVRQTMECVKIRGFLIDRGFFGVEYLQVLEDYHAQYLMGARMTKRIHRLWTEHHREAVQIKNDVETTEHLLVIKDHEIIKNKDERISTTLLILHRHDDDGSLLHAWVTNATEDPKAAARLVETYRQRWGIETGYRSKNEAHAYTASTHAPIRLFLILVSFLLYNWWRLTDWSLRDRESWKEKPELMYYVFREALVPGAIKAGWIRTD